MPQNHQLPWIAVNTGFILSALFVENVPKSLKTKPCLLPIHFYFFDLAKVAFTVFSGFQ